LLLGDELEDNLGDERHVDENLERDEEPMGGVAASNDDPTDEEEVEQDHAHIEEGAASRMKPAIGEIGDFLVDGEGRCVDILPFLVQLLLGVHPGHEIIVLGESAQHLRLVLFVFALLLRVHAPKRRPCFCSRPVRENRREQRQDDPQKNENVNLSQANQGGREEERNKAAQMM
jgi:hypothetical protein